MSKKIKIDDRSIATPPYSGPKDEPLPDRKLAAGRLDAMLRKLFPLDAEEDEEQSSDHDHLADTCGSEDFALRLKRGGPKWERTTNEYELALRNTYGDWAEKTARDLAAIEDDDEFNRRLEQAIEALIAALILLGRENLPRALELGLGGVPASPDGMRELSDALAMNEAYLTESLQAGIRDKVGERVAGEPIIKGDQAALAALLGTFVGRVGSYSGQFWSLVQRGLGDRVKQDEETLLKKLLREQPEELLQPEEVAIPVFWHLDPSVKNHCNTCLQFGDREYASWDDMIAETGGILPAQGTDCDGNCRCSVSAVVGDERRRAWVWTHLATSGGGLPATGGAFSDEEGEWFGGAGSGHWGHKGIPGSRGGSAGGGGLRLIGATAGHSAVERKALSQKTRAERVVRERYTPETLKESEAIRQAGIEKQGAWTKNKRVSDLEIAKTREMVNRLEEKKKLGTITQKENDELYVGKNILANTEKQRAEREYNVSKQSQMKTGREAAANEFLARAEKRRAEAEKEYKRLEAETEQAAQLAANKFDEYVAATDMGDKALINSTLASVDAANDRYMELNDAKFKARDQMREAGLKELAVSNPTQFEAKFASRVTGARKDNWQKGVDDFRSVTGSTLLPDDVTVSMYAVGKKRSYAQPWDDSVHLGSGSYMSSSSVVTHELAHITERSPIVKAKASAFLDYRTKGEAPQRLRDLTGNPSYDTHEVAKSDKFYSPYAGKQYGEAGTVRTTEIVSMGIEEMVRNPTGFARSDPEYFGFIYRLSRGQE